METNNTALAMHKLSKSKSVDCKIEIRKNILKLIEAQAQKGNFELVLIKKDFDYYDWNKYKLESSYFVNCLGYDVEINNFRELYSTQKEFIKISWENPKKPVGSVI